MIEDWIDIQCAVWAIDVGFTTVKSYRILQDGDFPAAINPAELEQQPIALTIPESVQPKYSKGYKKLSWYGFTQFHVAPDLNKSRLPSLLPWYGRILRATALKVQLSGATAEISNFMIMDRQDGIEGPIPLKYGAEDPHWGFVVNWMVEESLAGAALPVSG